MQNLTEESMTTPKNDTEASEKDDIVLLREKLADSSLLTSGITVSKQWQQLMRRFSDSQKEICKSEALEMPRLPRSPKTFPTGSEYEGLWNVLGMSGTGTYTFPYEGVKYVGEFEDGMFHGMGELQYECGAIIRGKWHNGEITERTLIFGDGSAYEDVDWKYCRAPDRRFVIENKYEMKPGTVSYMTAEQPTCEIPPGEYDVGDGFYNPKSCMVYKYDDPTAIVRAPGATEHDWILKNCRVSPDDPIGPNKYIYDKWLEPALELEPEHPTQSKMTNKIDSVYFKPSDYMRDTVAEEHSPKGKQEEKTTRESDTSYELQSFIFPDHCNDNNTIA